MGSNLAFSITPYTNTGFSNNAVSCVVNTTPALFDVYTTNATQTTATVNWNARFIDYVIVSWSNNGIGSNSGLIYSPASNYIVTGLTRNPQTCAYTVSAFANSSNIGTVTTSNVIPMLGLVGWYDGDSFSASASNWFNKVPGGSNITGVPSGVTVVTSTAGWKYINGKSTDYVNFPTDQMNSNFTLCYMGASGLTNTNNRWIVNRTGTTWGSGWAGGTDGTSYRSNLSYSGAVWTSPRVNTYGTNWLVGLEVNAPCIYRTNGISRSYSNFPVTISNVFSMRLGNGSGFANYSAAEFIIYNRALNPNEIDAVEGYMRCKYFPPTLSNLSASVGGEGTRVTFSWTPTPSNYDYINVVMGNFNVSGSLSNNVGSFTQCNLAPGSNYSFTITPYINNGFSISNYNVLVTT